MTEQLKEALSAVVDGEADEFELRRVLDEVGRMPELAAAWNRYHLIGEHVRGEPLSVPASSVSAMADAIWQDLSNSAETVEPAPAAEQVALFSVADDGAVPAAASDSSLRKWAPFAVAASVALMVLVGFNTLSDPPVAGDAPVVAESNIQIEGPVYQLATEVSPSDIRRANAYMLHHVQQKALNQPGVASFVKVATFEQAE